MALSASVGNPLAEAHRQRTPPVDNSFCLLAILGAFTVGIGGNMDDLATPG